MKDVQKFGVGDVAIVKVPTGEILVTVKEVIEDDNNWFYKVEGLHIEFDKEVKESDLISF